ncbi:lipopolysaccharide biosynthesis protein [Promicromonospora thailandica]|uniref:Membrane protein involved in the export of O-antigen and teichoic acid n=1 Tax=Promicromonospora thailandica TaxID=765201 RepID=A0A9X2GA06_9MICO|nr:lipopolysaccharide biosynthesis protein [Promicromonospora thailandica]MCP2264681.1 Membrane protein involved in the export of O-antigen and teichoic acid [Promicromonospora thailandica]BFF20241.1 lipopolysaccharide biosynthesis protein [Promicromonospora thailandica]
MSAPQTRPRVEALGRSAARGGVVTLAGQGIRALLQAASIIVLARLLGPTDYGYVAMIGAVVGAATILQDFGLSRAAVQAPSITRGQRDNLFWLNLACGAAAAAVVVAGAPALAAFYGEPVLVDITRWLAVPFLLGGLAAQFRASLMRDLRFTSIVVIDVAASAVGLVVAVGVAVLDGSYWALVAQQLVTAGVLAVGSVVAARWLPGLPRRQESVRSFISYGLHQLGAQLLTYASMNADTVVVGARFGTVSAGIYDRAFRMMMLPVRQLQYPVTRVAMPVLSRLQDDAAAFGAFVVRGQVILLNLLAPAMMLTAAVAEPVVEVVLGQRWLDVAPLFAVLALGGVFQAATFTSGWVFMATGRMRSQFRFALWSRPLVVLAVVLGSLWGVMGVAVAYGTTSALLWPVSLWWAGRAAGLPARQWLLSGCRTLAAHGVAALCAAGVVRLVGPEAPWAAIGLALATAVAALALEALVWPAFRRDLRDVARTRSLLRRERVAAG